MQTLKTLRSMGALPTHNLDQLASVLRDRLVALGGLSNDVSAAATSPADLRNMLAELSDEDAALMGAAVNFAYHAVCASAVELRALILETTPQQETDL